MSALLALGLILATLSVSVSAAPPVRAVNVATGGPVILGGDDLTDHGYIEDGELQQGWVYIRKALENIAPQVSRSGNNGTIAALGSEPSTYEYGDAGAAIGYAAAKAGLTVNYYNGSEAIEGFFSSLATGTAKPAIIWLAGTGASNNLEEDEGEVLTAHADQIASFVNTGGGLLAHGSGPYGLRLAECPPARAG